MLFLIEYNRGRGELITLTRFDESLRSGAQKARLELELQLNRDGIEHEVVLLEAPDEEALRRTHGRYFKNIAEFTWPTSDVSLVRERPKSDSE